MQSIATFLCLLCVSVNAAAINRGKLPQLRGLTDPPSWQVTQPSATDLAEESLLETVVFDPEGAVERSALKEAEALHNEWIRPMTNIKEFAFVNGTELAISAILWITFVLVVSFFYKRSSRYVPPKSSDPSKRQPLDSIDAKDLTGELSEWKSEWYQCYRYPEIFFWSCCCPCIRWAHTMDLLDFVDYWPAFLIFLLLSVLNQLTAFVFFGLILTILLVFYRQKTRQIFGMESQGSCGGVTKDFLGLCLCWPCFIAQEAFHVTEATRLGWTTELATKTGLGAKFEPSVSQEG